MMVASMTSVVNGESSTIWMILAGSTMTNIPSRHSSAEAGSPVPTPSRDGGAPLNSRLAAVFVFYRLFTLEFCTVSHENEDDVYLVNITPTSDVKHS